MRIGRLVPGGRLDRYVARGFLLSYLRAFCLVVGLFLILDMAANLDDYLKPRKEGEGTPGGDVVRFYMVQIPFIYMQMSPFVTLIAGLFTGARLSKHNEVVAALNAGASARRVFAPVFVLAAFFAAGVFVVREAAGESLGQSREILLDRLEEQRAQAQFENFWIHTTGRSLRVRTYIPAIEEGDVPEIRGLTFRDAGVAFRAERATPLPPFEEGRWQLEGSHRIEVQEGAKVTSAPKLLEEVRLTPSDVELAYRGSYRPTDLSFGELRKLLARSPRDVQYRTLYHNQLSFPLAGIVLLLVGLPFVVSNRRGGTVERVGMGFFLCVAYFGLDFVCRTLGMQNNLGSILSGWTPVLFFGSLGAVLFGSMSS